MVRIAACFQVETRDFLNDEATALKAPYTSKEEDDADKVQFNFIEIRATASRGRLSGSPGDILLRKPVWERIMLLLLGRSAR